MIPVRMFMDTSFRGTIHHSFNSSFMYVIQHCFICRPSGFPVSKDAGFEHRTFATLTLTTRCASHLARSHPHSARFHTVVASGNFHLVFKFLNGLTCSVYATSFSRKLSILGIDVVSHHLVFLI